MEREAFDEWRGRYRNPSRKHIGGKKAKNWDSALRMKDLESDGVVAEVIFPNTVPPFYSKAFHISPPPSDEQYPRWRAGTRAHNRWLSEFCAEEPKRRRGIGLIHLNDVDDAIEDVKWIAENGLGGGLLLPLPSTPDTQLAPLYAAEYDPLWADHQSEDWQCVPDTIHSLPRYRFGRRKLLSTDRTPPGKSFCPENLYE